MRVRRCPPSDVPEHGARCEVDGAPVKCGWVLRDYDARDIGTEHGVGAGEYSLFAGHGDASCSRDLPKPMGPDQSLAGRGRAYDYDESVARIVKRLDLVSLNDDGVTTAEGVVPGDEIVASIGDGLRTVDSTLEEVLEPLGALRSRSYS